MSIDKLAEQAYAAYKTTIEAEVGKPLLPWNQTPWAEKLGWINATEAIINADLWESV